MSNPRDLGPTDVDRPTGADDGEPTGEDLRDLGEEGGPIGLRVGRDPGNLGDDIPEAGDVTHPPAVDETPQM